MDELEHAAELIERAIEALSVASISNATLRPEFERRCDHLRELRREINAALRERRRVRRWH